MRFVSRHNSNLLWVIMTILSVIGVAAFFTAQYFFSPPDKTPVTQQTSSALTVKSEIISPNINQNVSLEQNTHPSLINQDDVRAPIPEHATLAQEELAKLDDIETQLQDQKNSLNAQHQDADQLIKLKQEQIQLLEQQLQHQ